MTPYLINVDNSGLKNDEQVREMVRLLQAKGYAVEFTRDLGLVNPSETCPCTDADWESALTAASYLTGE